MENLVNLQKQTRTVQPPTDTHVPPLVNLYNSDECRITIRRNILYFTIFDFTETTRQFRGSTVVQALLHDGRSLRGLIFDFREATGEGTMPDMSRWPVVGLSTLAPLVVFILPRNPFLQRPVDRAVAFFREHGLHVATAFTPTEAARRLQAMERTTTAPPTPTARAVLATPV